jgi:hypothetical protein
VRQNRIRVPSNLLLECTDLWEGSRFLYDRFERIAPLADGVASALGVDCPRTLSNDGNAVAALVAGREHLREALVIQAGTSLAGGYVDVDGHYDGYLTELGRCVLDLDQATPEHPFSGIAGLARELASNSALRRRMIDVGVFDRMVQNGDGLQKTIVNRHNAGKIADVILKNPTDPAHEDVCRVVRDVGENLGHFVRVSARHLPIRTVLLSGGIFRSNSEVSNILQDEVVTLLAQSGERIKVLSAPEADEFVGARAAAWVAATRAD